MHGHTGTQTCTHTESFRLKKTSPRGDTLNTQKLPPILQTPVQGRRCTGSHPGTHAGWFQSSCAQGGVSTVPQSQGLHQLRERVLLSPLPVQGALDIPALASTELKSFSQSLWKHLCSS